MTVGVQERASGLIDKPEVYQCIVKPWEEIERESRDLEVGFVNLSHSRMNADSLANPENHASSTT